MPKPSVASSFRRNSFHGVEKASETFSYGDFLIPDATGGKIRECVLADTKILGLAEGDSSGVEDTAVVVHELFPGDIIAIDIYNNHASAAVDASTLDKGQICGIVAVAGEWYAEIENDNTDESIISALSFIEPQGPLRDELYGNTVYRGLFRILEAACVTVQGVA